MKNIIISISFIAAALLLAGCEKEKEFSNASDGQMCSEGITVMATIDDYAKVGGTDTGTGIKVRWEEGDTLRGYYVVSGVNYPVKFVVSGVDESSGMAVFDARFSTVAGTLEKGTKFYMFYGPEEKDFDLESGTFSLDWGNQDGDLKTLLREKAYMKADEAILTDKHTLSLRFHNITSIIKISGMKTVTKKDDSTLDTTALAENTALRLSADGGMIISGKLDKNGFSDFTYGEFTTVVRDSATYIAIPRVDATIASISISLDKDAEGYGLAWIASSQINTSQKTAFVIKDKVIDSETYMDHPFVDLGLKTPDGKPLYFATRNIGASSVADKGQYFKWGETSSDFTVNWTSQNVAVAEGNGKMWCEYDHSDYKDHEKSPYYADTDNNNGYYYLSKYVNKAEYAQGGGASGDTKGSIDDLTVLVPDDDAANVLWGGNWRIPTLAELQMLNELTKAASVKKSSTGVDSWGVEYSTEGATMFLPGTSRVVYNGNGVKVESAAKSGSNGGQLLYYWTRNLDTTTCYQAICTSSAGKVTDIELSSSAEKRCYGLAIRPVFEGK